MCYKCCRCYLCPCGKEEIEERVLLKMGGDTNSIRKRIKKCPITNAMFRMLCDVEREKMYRYC